MKCKKCGNVRFRRAHRTLLERWLSQVIPVHPYQCSACDYRQMRRIKPFFNTSRMVSAFVFGLILTFISTTLIVSLTVREPMLTADDHPTLGNQPRKPVLVEPTPSEPSPEPILKSALGQPHPSKPPSIAGNDPSASTLTKSDHVVERDIRPERSSTADAELENTPPPSVMAQAGNNQMSWASVKPRSVPSTIDDNKRAEFPKPVSSPVNNRGASSDHLDTFEIESSRQIVRVRLQGTGPFDQFKFFELDKGERLVVDLPGQWRLASGIGTKFFVNTDWLYRIRLGKHARFFRLVFDVKENRSATPKIETSNRAMTITLRLG